MVPEYLRTILFLTNDNAAKYYHKYIYPHEIGTLIVTADKTWPREKKLRDQVWEAINNNDIKCCIVIGTKHLNMVKHLSNVFVIDQFLIEAKKHTQIAKIVHRFTNMITITEGAEIIPKQRPDSILSSIIFGNKVKLEEIDFKEIKEIWDNKLWPGRDSKPVHETDKFANATDVPTFFGLYLNDKLVGVNSGYPTGDTYRSRGLWVDPDYRGMGLSRMLLEPVIEDAEFFGATKVWSLPNVKALHAYKAVGFIWGPETLQLDYGENKYATRKI